MALIKCPKCSGTVSTKAPACPHCGFTLVNTMSEKERIEKVADELGSMSAALSASDESLPAQTLVKEPAPSVAPSASGSDSASSPTSNFIYGFVVMAIVGFKLTTCAQRFIHQRSTQTHYKEVELIKELDTKTSLPQKPVFGTKSEHFSLDQYMRVPKANEK